MIIIMLPRLLLNIIKFVYNIILISITSKLRTTDSAKIMINNIIII